MTTDDTAFASHIDRLLRDPLLCARATSALTRVVGYVGDVPVELILAAKALPIRLRGVAGASTPLADRYLESAFSPEVRAIAELWLSGQLDDLHSVVFPRNNDGVQRLYYYLCELQRTGRCAGPRPLLFDVATLERRTSFDHTLESTRALAVALGSDIAELRNAIERTDKRASSMEKAATELPGSEAFRIQRAHELDWRASFDASLNVRLMTNSPVAAGKRILFVGNSPPDARFHVAVEEMGAMIVHECTDARSHAIASNTDDLVAAIAQRHHFGATLAQQMFRSPVFVAALAHRVRADGVILWAIEEDETLPWEIARQLKSLKDARVPVLSLTRQSWLPNDATLNDVKRFAASLERRQ